MEQHHAPQQGKTSGRWVQCSGTTPSLLPSLLYFTLSVFLPHSETGQRLMNQNQTDREGYCAGKDEQSPVGSINRLCVICQ